MSAINPASFVTPPSAGLPAPNPLRYNQEGQTDHSYPHETSSYGPGREGPDTGREGLPNPIGVLRSAYPESYQNFGQSSRMPELGLGGLGAGDPFAPYSPSASSGLDSAYDYPVSPSSNTGPPRMHPGHGDWVNHFQGLSLGS